jgi:hypothetical protein
MTPRPRPKARPVFVLRLRPEPGVIDPARALRALLKTALRRFGLRCMSCVEDGGLR